MQQIDHIASILKLHDIEPKPLDRLVHDYMRLHKEIGSANRRAISDAVFDIMRLKSRIDGFLLLGGYKKADNKFRAEFYLNTRGLLRFARNDEKAVLVCHCEERMRRSNLHIPIETLGDDKSKNFPGGDAAFYCLPDFIFSALKKCGGKDYAIGVATAFNERAPKTMRVNTLLTNRDKLVDLLHAKNLHCSLTQHSPYGFSFLERVNLDTLPEYKNGLFEVQDESSQLAVVLSCVSEGEVVLDACSGAGGKALAMAMQMNNKGTIIASDIDESKLKILRSRAKRAQVKNIIIERGQTPKNRCQSPVLERPQGEFDLVFIDAPCSGSGTFRRAPDLKWRLTEKIIRERIKTQSALLSGYSRLVKKGGRLLYATCSVLPSENEEVIEKFLSTHKFKIINAAEIFKEKDIPSDGLVDDHGFMKLNPSEGAWDGFFAALLVKVE